MRPLRTARGRHQATRAAARRAVSAVLAVVALLAAQLTLLTVVPATTATAATPGKGAPFDCYGGTVYNVQSTSGTLNALDTSTLGSSSVTTTAITSVPGETSADALAITTGGTAAYTVHKAPTGSTTALYRYDPTATGQSWTTYANATANAGDTYVAGAYDPANKVYYYADYSGGVATVYGWNTDSNTPIPGVIASIQLPISTGSLNGDMAFDRAGNLYLVESTGTATDVAVVRGPLPASGNDTSLQSTTLSSLPDPNGETFNGIAFDNSGYLYTEYTAGTSTYLQSLNPNTGADLGAATQQNLAASGTGVDLAACSLNPTVTLKTKIVGRSQPGDQFTMSVTGGGITHGNTGTTTGTGTSAGGAQAGPVIGVSGTTYSVADVAASGSLSHYTSTYVCTDAAAGDRTVASGSGASFDLAFPDPAGGATGPDVTCTFTLTPTAAALDTVKTIKTVNGVPPTSSTPLAAGDKIVYNVTATNSGGTAGSTTLTDTVPADTTYSGSGEGWSAACSPGAAAGTSCTQAVSVPVDTPVTTTFTATVDNPLPAAVKSIANTVTASSGGCSSCTAIYPITPILDTDLSLTSINGDSSATASTPVASGNTIVYTTTVTNAGGAGGSTVLTDVVPANTTYTGTGWSCPSASAGSSCMQTVTVPAGSSRTVTYTVTVGTLPTGTQTVANSVVPGTGDCSTCSISNPTAAVLDSVATIATVNGASATSATQVGPGDVVRYDISTTNTGGSADTTMLSDSVPANTTYTGAAQGWSCSAPAAAGTACTQPVTVPANGGPVTKSYTVTVAASLPVGTHSIATLVHSSAGTCSACNPSNPTVAALDTVTTLASVNAAPATASTPVKAGDVLVYNVKITNTGGTSAATTVTDDVPANASYTGSGEGWSCVAPAPTGTACAQTVTVAGNDASVTLPYTVTVGAFPAGTLAVADQVTTTNGTCSACNPSNPTVAVLDTTKQIFTVNGTPAAPTTTIAAGDLVTYQVTVHNTGGADGTTVLSDTVPANTIYTGSGQGWSCAAGATAGAVCSQSVTAPGGSSVTRSYTVTVAAPLPAGTPAVANVITSDTGTCSACSVSNPTAPVLDTVKAISTVNGTPAGSSTALAAGDVVTYTLTTTNTGGTTGTTLLSDPVPANTTFGGSPTQGWSCSSGAAAGTACTQSVTVAAGSTASVSYTATVVTPVPSGTTTITNTVTSPGGSCSACRVSNPTVAELDTVKTLYTVNGAAAGAATQLDAGDHLTYRLTTTNKGGASGSTTLTETVPAHTTFAGIPAQGWSCAAGATAGTTCTHPATVSSGLGVAYYFQVTVDSPLPDDVASIDNTVTSSPGGCSACSTSNLVVAKLATVKTITTVNGGPATAATALKAGDEVEYTITTRNTGGASATTTLSDTVPAHTSYTGSAEGWSCATGSAAGAACTQPITVPGGGSTAVTYTLTVGALPGGTLTVGNQVTSSVGTCSACTVSNPTVAVLATTKVVATVNGSAATAATPLTAGDVVSYRITTTNTGGSSGTTALSDVVPTDTTYSGTGEGWSCATGSAAASSCLQPVTVPSQGSVSTDYTLTVVTPLPAGTQSIANTVTSSDGACSACTVTNPTVAALDTVKTIVSVNGASATGATAVHAGDVISYAVQVTNTGGSSGTTTLADVVPAHTSYSGSGEGWSCAAGAAAGTSCTQAVTVGANVSVTRAYTLTVGALPSGTTSVSNTVTTTNGTCSSCGVSNPTGGLLSTVKTIATVNGAPAGPTTALAAGDVVVYHLAVTNSGGASSATTLSDPVPANTTYSGGNGEGWSCTAPAPPGSGCTRTVTVGAGATVTANYTLTVVTPLPTGTQSIVNTATSGSGTCAACSVSNPTVAALTTVKTVTSVNGAAATATTPVGPGDVIGYSVRVANTGGSPGTTTLSDPVPAHTSYTGSGEGWSCTAPAPAATSCTQDVTVLADSALAESYTVTVASLPSGILTITNTVASSNSTCSACSVSNPTVAALDTVKTVMQVDGVTASTATPVQAGDTITYALTVDNTGGSDGTTNLIETVPANTRYSGGSGEGWTCGVTTCTQTVTAPAATPVSRTFTVTVGALPPGTQSIVNTVTPSVGTCSACSVSNPTVPTLDTVKTVAAIDGDLTATSATPVRTGDTITYDLTVTNSGGAPGSTTLTETIPANTRYSGGSGEGWTCGITTCTQTVTAPAATPVTKTFTVTVLALPTGTQTIANTVAPSVGTCSACSVSNPTVADLDTVKTVTRVNGSTATTATQVQAGDTITYGITVTNTGGSTGSATLTDVVPANTTYTGSGEGWICNGGTGTCTQDVTVAADDSITLTYTVTVVDPLPVGTQAITNTVASSNGGCSACSVSNPTIAALDTVKTIKTVNGAAATATTAVGPGDVVAYRIVVTNTGGSSGSTTLGETVPAGTTYTGSGEGWSCAIGSVAGTACTHALTVGPGSSATTTFTVTVDALPKGTQTVDNTVASSNSPCSACSVSNPTVPVLDTVKAIGSIDGDTSATPATQVAGGDVIVYTITVTNTGGSSGSTTLTDVVPANTTYTGSGEGWSCLVGSCTQLVTVPAAGSITKTFTVTVAASLADGVRTVTNTVASSNGTCSACTVTNPTVAALHTVKRLVTIDGQPTTAAQQVKPGDVLAYSMTVTNGGGSAGTTTLTDAVPAATTYTGAASEGWSCPATIALSPCTQDLTVAPGASAQRMFTMTLDTPLPSGLQTVANTVASSSGTCVPCSVVNPTVGTLSVSKTITTINGAPATAGDQVRAGDVLTYAIRAVNTGGASATTRLSDEVPADATYTGRGEGWSCTAPAVTGTPCTQDVTIDPASTKTVTYTMTVAATLPKGTATIANTVGSSQGSCTLCTATNPTIATLDTVKALATVDGQPVVGSARVQGGDVLGYTVTVTNTGGSPLSTVLTETVPAHTTYTGHGEGWSCAASSTSGTRCTQPVLVPAQTAVTRRFTVTVASPVAAGTTQLVNAVTTSNGTCSACRVTTPLATSDIVVTKTADRTSASIGQQLTFTVRVHNNGPDGATDLTVTDRPTGLRYVSSTVTRGTFDPASGVWTIGALESSADAVLQANYVVTSSASSNTATADNPAQRDPVYSNGVSAVVVSGPGNGSGLASTGVPIWTLIRDAALLLLAGCALMFVTRRRRRPTA